MNKPNTSNSASATNNGYQIKDRAGITRNTLIIFTHPDSDLSQKDNMGFLNMYKKKLELDKQEYYIVDLSTLDDEAKAQKMSTANIVFVGHGALTKNSFPDKKPPILGYVKEVPRPGKNKKDDILPIKAYNANDIHDIITKQTKQANGDKLKVQLLGCNTGVHTAVKDGVVTEINADDFESDNETHLEPLAKKLSDLLPPGSSVFGTPGITKIVYKDNTAKYELLFVPTRCINQEEVTYPIAEKGDLVLFQNLGSHSRGSPHRY